MEMVGSGRREMKPLLLKAGIALALSIAGFLISHLRYRLRRPVPWSRSEPAEAGGKGLKDELRFLKSDDSTAKIINGTSTTTTTTTTTTTKTFVSLSPKSRSSGDDEGYLLPEFKGLVPEATSPRQVDAKEEPAMEQQEILRLKKLVWSLKERERSLQLQLFEYYGLQEQENAVRELEGQLRINSMEAKLLALEMEALQGDYRRLQMDYSKGMGELDAARGTVKSLKRKMKSESEQSREKISALQQRVSLLQADADAERKLRRYEELESEAASLRILNSRLEQMNSELRQQLEASIPEAKDVEEAKNLKDTNSKLVEEIEQLQTSHCADVEELVYLRWVNACLRYEARNYQPPPGKTMARDLSKTLSPKSEEKAKQLILRYANSLDSTRSSPPMDFDTECSPSSQILSVGESDETSCDAASSSSTGPISSKSKLFRKLKKLILRKGHHHHRSSPPVSADVTPTSCSNSERRVSFSTCSTDDMIGGRYSDSVSSSSATERTPDNQFAAREAPVVDGQRQNKQARDMGRSSLDIQGMRRNSADANRAGDKSSTGTPYSFRRTTSIESPDGGSTRNGGRHARDPAKVELKKFAEALNRSRVMKKFVRSSTSCTD